MILFTWLKKYYTLQMYILIKKLQYVIFFPKDSEIGKKTLDC